MRSHAIPHLNDARLGPHHRSRRGRARGRRHHHSVGLDDAAVLNPTKSLALLLAPRNVLVNAAVPHIIDTDRQDETMRLLAALTGKAEVQIRRERLEKPPLKRMGWAEEVAAVVAFLASERSSFVTDAAWHVDGGARHGIRTTNDHDRRRTT